MVVISFVFKLDELLISEYYKKIFKVEIFQGRNINSENKLEESDWNIDRSHLSLLLGIAFVRGFGRIKTFFQNLRKNRTFPGFITVIFFLIPWQEIVEAK